MPASLTIYIALFCAVTQGSFASSETSLGLPADNSTFTAPMNSTASKPPAISSTARSTVELKFPSSGRLSPTTLIATDPSPTSAIVATAPSPTAAIVATAPSSTAHGPITISPAARMPTASSPIDANLTALSSAAISPTVLARRLLNPRKYDRLFRPSGGGGGPTQVSVGVSILSFGPVNQVNMEFGVEMLLNMRWTDERLRHSDDDRILVLSRLADSVWLPGLYFRGATAIKRQDRPSRNILLWLWPNGTMQYSQKLEVKFRCRMDVRHFPFDTQTCSIEASVFDLSSSEQLLNWSASGVAFDCREAEFNSEFFPPIVSVSGGVSFSPETWRNFSHLAASFELRRRHSHYLISNYLPSTFIVLSTWSSFAIDHKSPPARVALSALCLMAQLTQSLSLESKLPQVSYVTSLGVWHTGCIAFVYLSLLEYMMINLLRIRKQRRRKRLLSLAAKRKRSGTQMGVGASDAAAATVAGAVVKLSSSSANACWYLTPSRLDLACLIAYPIAFSLFNVFYWVIIIRGMP